MWTQIKQKEDEEWIEWHRKDVTARYGEVMLKVWINGNGRFCGVAVETDDLTRHVMSIGAETIEDAKECADYWAKIH